MTTLKSRWLDWQPSPPLSAAAADDPSSEPHASEKRTDKTDKRYPPGPHTSEKRTDKTDRRAFVSFVSAVSGHIAVDGDQGAGAWDAADWHDHYEERAAIIEHDGQLPRPEAEHQALADTVDHWLATHPPGPTDDIVCVHCGADLGENGVPVLAGTGHTWLHSACHAPWLTERRHQAAEVMATMGVGVAG